MGEVRRLWTEGKTMKNFLHAGALTGVAIVAAIGLSATSAGAAVYISQLDLRDAGNGHTIAGNFGTVMITELTPDSLKVEVDLTNSDSLFINTGGPHNPFVFNTLDADTHHTPAQSTDDPNAITLDSPSNSKFGDAGRAPTSTSFDNTPFGDFTNEIELNSGNGKAGGVGGPLIFTISDPHGITFAGLGATFSSTGQVLTLGTGDHLASNALGVWFAADIYDGATGQTYNVAAKDAFLQPGVPEPATWGLMILGLGGVGGLLRRRRSATAFA